MRERELKLLLPSLTTHLFKSLPMRERELKHILVTTDFG